MKNLEAIRFVMKIRQECQIPDRNILALIDEILEGDRVWDRKQLQDELMYFVSDEIAKCRILLS